MYRERLTPWIVGTALTCAALGAGVAHLFGDGGSGHVALISAACAVLGSFLPGAVRWTRMQLRGRRSAAG